jgi:hypothetical protein
MPFIIELRTDIEEYIKEHGLSKKWGKSKKLFENNPSHPSLNTELLDPIGNRANPIAYRPKPNNPVKSCKYCQKKCLASPD